MRCLRSYPSQTAATTYVSFTPGPVQIDQFTGDILQVFSAKDQLHGFYAYQADKRTEPICRATRFRIWRSSRWLTGRF